MRCAYIGLVSRNGLESLLPENDVTRDWSLAAARRRRDGCVWTHVDHHVAGELSELLAADERAAALRMLTEHADAVGPLT